jgi:hypothetical protein
MKRDDYYAPLPCGFFRHPKTKAARAADAKAPEAFLVLLAEAELQHRAGGDFGHVRMAWDDFALCAGLPVTAPVTNAYESILGALGFVEWITGVVIEPYGFRAVLPNMGEWSHKDPKAAERQARSTARKAEEVRAIVGGEGVEGGKYSPDHLRLSRLLADLIMTRDPKARVDPESVRWLDAIRLLIDRDGRSAREVEHVIRWAQADSFWQSNILSTPKLRAKFDQLFAKAGKPPRGLADLDALGR